MEERCEKFKSGLDSLSREKEEIWQEKLKAEERIKELEQDLKDYKVKLSDSEGRVTRVLEHLLLLS